MRKIYLHGTLGDKYGAVVEMNVATAGEAVRALRCNFPEILKDLREGAWHVVRGDDIDAGLALGEDDLLTFRLGKGDLHFVPVVAGSKRAGLLKVVLGVALIGVGLFMGFGAPILGAAASGGVLGGLTYGNLAMMGAAMALAGVSQMLAPEEEGGGDKESSFTFSGPGNSYEQGAPVPLVYGGPLIVGGVMISGGVDIEKIAVGA